MKTNPGPTDPAALDVKTPTDPVAPPKPPGAAPPAGGYHLGTAPTLNPEGWDALPEEDAPGATADKPET